MAFRDRIIAHYRLQVQDKIDAFRDMIAALAEDSRNDAKGSAGDKHETALSMMHIEQEKITVKLAEWYAHQEILGKIAAAPAPTRIASGSILQANDIFLFISAAFPKTIIDGKTVIALSPSSPLGGKLLGKEAGFQFEISGTSYTVKKVF